MTIRITLVQPGWETYNGMLVGCMFTNGVCEEMTDRQAAQIGNILRVERDDGSNPSSSQELINNKADLAGVAAPMVVGGQEVIEPVADAWTREKLEEIGSTRGIVGIREISDPMSLRDTSISKLIDKILMKQSGDTGIPVVSTQLEPLPAVVGPIPVVTPGA